MSTTQVIIDQIQERISLRDLIGQHVKLTKRGLEFIGLCPFHNEKTPSFHVVETKGFYHCFGCGANGGALQWVMDRQRLDFREALKYCADLAGISLPEYQPKNREEYLKAKDESAIVKQVLKLTNEFFIKNLYTQNGKPALDYLRGRGLNQDNIAEFGLGYCGYDGEEYLHFLQKNHDIQAEILINIGLANKFENQSKIFPFWRNRIMFPIHDKMGQVIAFGGRYMGNHDQDNTGKYINSKDSNIFHKSDNLYNVHRMRQNLKSHPFLCVVEGYMDVIALAAQGFSTAVAPLGTAITESQITQLWKYQDNIILALDGDKAGQKATMRTILLAMAQFTPQKQISVVKIPNGDDPDSFIMKHGLSKWQELISNATSGFQYFYHELQQNYDLKSPQGRAGFNDEGLKILQNIHHASLRKEYIREFNQLNWQNRLGSKAIQEISSQKPTNIVGNRAQAIVAYMACKREFYENIMAKNWQFSKDFHEFSHKIYEFSQNHQEWDWTICQQWFVAQNADELWQKIFNAQLRIMHPEIWQNDDNQMALILDELMQLEMHAQLVQENQQKIQEFGQIADDSQKKYLYALDKENDNYYNSTNPKE